MKDVVRVIVLILGTLLFIANGVAQERGQYIPGFRGLNPAEQPHTGFTYGNFFYYYPTSTLKDRDGNNANTNFDVGVFADVSLFAYTPKKKFLGATYAASMLVPFMNVVISLPRVGVDTIVPVAFGDIYVEPISLGWTVGKGKGKIRTAYGFMTHSGARRVSMDYLGHQVTFAGTYHPDKAGMWQISGNSVWEFHNKKQHEDVKVGNNVTIEYGVGKTFVKNKGAQIYQFGVAGYTQLQLTQDSGTDVVPFNVGVKDRVFAVGPEFDAIFPKSKVAFAVRVLPEFGTRSRTQGVTVLMGVIKTF